MSGVLDNVKVGDKLYVTSRLRKSIEIVEKVTKFHVITRNGKYRKSGDSVGGDGWTNSYARPASEEDIENVSKEIARNMMLATCRKINFDSLSDAQLEQILKIVNPDLLNGK